MKIAIMGAGALGGYFGGRLVKAGHDVSFIARGAHLKAMQDRGLKILSPKGDLDLPKVDATDNPAEVGPVNVVFFMVKNRDVETSAEAILPLLGPETMVVTCQNGITAWERLAAVVGRQHVVPGVAKFPAEISEPGVIRHSAPLDFLIFGEVDGAKSKRCTDLLDVLQDAGTTPIIPESILHELWAKFCTQTALASLTTLTGLNVGPLRENPVSRQLFRDAVSEVANLGRAVDPTLPESLIEKNWEFVMGLPATMHASMVDDLRNGKPLEHEYLSGDVVRLGQKLGVETPIHAVLYAALKPIADPLSDDPG